MTGIEKITARIQEDAQQEVDAVLAEAKAQADSITARYAAQAEQAAAAIREKGERSAEECRQRLNSTAQMDAKKKALSAKQEMLDKAFALALEKLNQLPEEEYVDLLAKLAVKASASGSEQLIFSATDPGTLRCQSGNQGKRDSAKGRQARSPDAVRGDACLPGRPAGL